jgi:hypothetical protein
MVAHEGCGRSCAHIGIPEPHHPVSHHGDTPEGIAKYGKLTTYHVTKLAEVVEKLKATADGKSSTGRCSTSGAGWGTATRTIGTTRPC